MEEYFKQIIQDALDKLLLSPEAIIFIILSVVILFTLWILSIKQEAKKLNREDILELKIQELTSKVSNLEKNK